MSTATSTQVADGGRLASGTEVGEHNRAAWLAERRRSVGASEVAAIVGADPHRTALDVFMSKVHPGEAEPETFAQWFGLAMEPVLARAYERETGRTVARRQVFVRAEELPWMTATLDGVADGGRIVEFKTVNARNREIVDQLGEPGTDEVPPVWLWQLTHQLVVWGDSEADLAVLVGGGDFRVYTVKCHPRLSCEAIVKAGQFWRLVEAGTPPPPTSPDDARHLAVLYREARGEVELDEGLMEAASEYQEYGDVARGAEKWRASARLKLLAALGPADVGRLPDGRTVRRSVVEVKAHEVRASTQVRLSVKGGRHGQDEG